MRSAILEGGAIMQPHHPGYWWFRFDSGREVPLEVKVDEDGVLYEASADIPVESLGGGQWIRRVASSRELAAHVDAVKVLVHALEDYAYCPRQVVDPLGCPCDEYPPDHSTARDAIDEAVRILGEVG